MSIYYSIFLYLFGLFLFFSNNKKYVINYLLLWVCFAPLLYHVTIGLDDDIQYYNIIQWARYLGLTIFLVKTIGGKYKSFKSFYILLFFFLLYSIFLSVERSTSISSTVKFVFGSFFDLMILLGLYGIEVHKRSLISLMNITIIIEFACSIYQYISHTRFFPHTSGVSGIEISGTFMGANLMSEFVALLLYVVICIDSCKGCGISTKNIILIILVTIVEFISGVRTALISHILILTVLFVYFYKDKFVTKKSKFRLVILLLVFFAIAGSFFFSYINTADVTYDINVTSASERQNVITSIFIEDNYFSEHTTFYYTIYVLSFFSMNPILGPGLLYKSTSGYGGLVNTAAGNLTDCTLALYICESGIIGIIFFIIIYRELFKKLAKGSFGPKLLFYYMIIITITDPGIFFIANYLVFIALLLIEKQERNELSKRRLQEVL